MSDPTAKTVDGDLAPADNVFGFDPASVERLPLSDLLRRMGPGFILAGIQLGPGSLTTSAMLGGDYAYQLLWVLLPVIFMGTTFILVAYRLSMATGLPTIDAIRKYYGNAAATFVGLVTFFACVCFNIGNVAGIGAGMSLIFGIDWKIGAAIVMVFVFLCYFLKGVYGKIEKAVTACIAIMAIAFIVVLVMTGGPDWAGVGAGLTRWQFPEGSIVTVLGFLGSSASVLAGMYGTYLGAEKEWKKRDLFNGVMTADALAQVVGTVVISGVVILVGAIVLNPTGTDIKNLGDLAAMLVPAFGGFANIVMGIAFLAAAFAAIMGNTGRCSVFLNAGLNKPTKLDGRNIKITAAVILVAAMVIAFIYGSSPIQLTYFSNVLTSIGTPVAGFFITRMIWRKDVHRGVKPPRALQICMTVSYIFYTALMLFALYRAVPNFLGSIM